MLKKYFALLVLVSLAWGCAQVSVMKKPPIMRFSLDRISVEPGHSMKAVFESEIPMQVSLETQGQIVQFDTPLEKQGLVRETYFSIPLETIPDQYALTLTAWTSEGERYVDYYTYQVVERSPFKISHLWIKSFGKYNFATESKVMKQARGTLPEGELFSSVDFFDWPVRGRISEVFGVKRVYNGGKNSWYHGGIDIAAPGGTLILAPADGVVLLTRPFKAHGNATLVYHGFGIVTTYLHQKKIMVEEGQRIKRGDVIGQVGTTGSSTGNHLHFQVNIHHVKCDPFDFISVKE